MNYLKSIALIFFTVLLFTSCKEQSTNESVETKETESVDMSAEKEAVLTVMRSYRDAIQNLTVENTEQLFTEDSQMFESGGVEGSYKTYKEHHLGPELKYFKSFNFNNYKAEVVVDLPYAFATETYVYEIVIAANEEKGREERTISKKGVATVVLKKEDGNWKIYKYHSSSRDVKPDSH
jgi:ketosteroid isomerase-like protein